MKFNHLILACLLCLSSVSFAQETKTEITNSDIVEVSGIILTRSQNADRPERVPFASVAVKGTARGTYANYQGMFSIVVRKGETLTFSAVGFENFVVEIPETLEGIRKTVMVELESKPIELDQVLVFPWPDRNNLRAEFLAMDPNEALRLEDVAKDNLNERRMLAIANAMEMDGRENSHYYLQMQARDFSYQGQRAPTPIFDPIAWSKFFKSFNKKKKTKEEKEEEEMLKKGF